MTDDPPEPPARHRAVPSGRVARLGAFGRLAGGVAGGMIAEGARRLARGERPALGELALTPANATRVAEGPWLIASEDRLARDAGHRR